MKSAYRALFFSQFYFDAILHPDWRAAKYLFFYIVSTGILTASPTIAADGVWTDSRRDALVFIIRTDVGADKGGQGTGFIVRGDTHDWVLTAAHVLISDTTTATANVEAIKCHGIDPNWLELRRRYRGGDKLYAECFVFIAPHMAAIKLKPLEPRLAALELGIWDKPRDGILSRIGYAAQGDLSITPERAELEHVSGPENTIVYRAATAGGLSGSPYMSSDSKIVAMHQGVITLGMAQPGWSAVSLVRRERIILEKLGIQGMEKARDIKPGKQKAVVRIYEQSPGPGRAGKDRSPESDEVEVAVYRGGEFSSSRIISSIDGSIEMYCDPDEKVGFTSIRAIHRTQDSDYVGRFQNWVCDTTTEDEPMILALTHRERFAARELSDAAAKINQLWSFDLPDCLKQPDKSASYRLDCRKKYDATGQLIKNVSAVAQFYNRILDHYRLAIEEGAKSTMPEAQRQYGNFLVRMGQPCDGKDYLREAARARSLAGPQSIRGWIDSVTACASGVVSRDVITELAGVWGEEDVNWRSAAANANFLKDITILFVRATSPTGNTRVAAEEIIRRPILNTAWETFFYKYGKANCAGRSFNITEVAVLKAAIEQILIQSPKCI